MRLCVRIALFALAIAFIAAAAWMDGRWWVRHVVVPACYLPPPAWMLPAVRGSLAAVGLAFGVVALIVRRLSAADLGRVGLAIVAALCVVEIALRVTERPADRARHPRLEFLLGSEDARTGWSFVPGRIMRFGQPGGGPVVEYAVDAHGDRAPSAGFVEDPQTPTLLVTGESIATGHGLEWRDTFAAQAGARLGLQVVNVAEGGYGSDQALLRAGEALLRLRHPVALVSTVLPVQLHRNLSDARPHLELRDGELVLAPAFWPRIRLRELFVDDLQILPEWRLQNSLRLTRAILEATARAARDRGARPLFVLPLFTAEPEPVRELLAGLPHVVVELQPERIMPWDGHPDPRGAGQIADAIVSALQSSEAVR